MTLFESWIEVSPPLGWMTEAVQLDSLWEKLEIFDVNSPNTIPGKAMHNNRRNNFDHFTGPLVFLCLLGRETFGGVG